MGNKNILRILELKRVLGTRRACKAVFAKVSKNDLKYIQIIKDFFASQYHESIKRSRVEFEDWNKKTHESKEQLLLWTLWWQGYDQMPPVVKLCYQKQKTYAESKNAKLILLTKDNIGEYVDIPQIILEKVDKKIITLTHFSDIIRIFLLEQYGGAWIDSTLLIDNSIYETSFEDNDFFSFHLPVDVHTPSGTGQVLTECKWSGFMLYSKTPHNPIFVFLKRSIVDYWEKYDVLVDYFIMNFLIRVLYDNEEYAKRMIDVVSYNNPCLYDLNPIMGKKYLDDEWYSLRRSTDFFKLSWKEKYIKLDDEGDTTFYGRLCENIKS